jgi:hypothetical protein
MSRLANPPTSRGGRLLSGGGVDLADVKTKVDVAPVALGQDLRAVAGETGIWDGTAAEWTVEDESDVVGLIGFVLWAEHAEADSDDHAERLTRNLGDLAI